MIDEDPTVLATPEGDATRPLGAAELAAGRATIGRYEIREVLGRGGMGVVVSARDPELDRLVAVKILAGGASADRGAALRREAQALARVTHANVVGVFDSGVDGSPYLVMQLVTGETLGAHLARTRPAPREIVALFVQTARGLAAIHAAGLIHRDFKPSNALIDRSGVVRVSDLGLARIDELVQADSAGAPGGSIHTNTIAGTPAYMAPEQLDGKELTPACDQFSLCVALWEALAGARPFPSAEDSQRARVIREHPLRTGAVPGLTKRQQQALVRGLSADPPARFPTMDALIAELAPRARTPWLIGGAAALAGIGAIAAVASARSGSTPAPSPPPPAPPPNAPLQFADAHRLTTTDTCDEYPSLGPDGTVYFDGVEGGDSHLMAIDPARHATRTLTHIKGWDLGAQVSPDGKRIAFIRRTDATMAPYVAALDDLDHPRRLLAAGAGRPAWSPDGKFVWAGARKGYSRFDATTGTIDRTVELPAGAFPMAAIELADGRLVLLTKTGAANADGLAIYDRGATKSRWLLPPKEDRPMDEVLALAPSGTAVITAQLTVTSNVELWTVPLDGAPPSVVSGAAINARKKLAFGRGRMVWSDCTEGMTIAELTLTAAGQTKFIDFARNKWSDFQPAASTTSHDVLFISERTTDAEIWRTSGAGADAKMIPFGHILPDRMSISPDGAWIAAANDDGLYVGPADGSAPPKKLIKIAGSEHNATFSGDRVIFESRDGERDRIASIPRGGGTPTWVLPAPSTAPAQSPVAPTLAYLVEEPAAGPMMRVVMLLDQRTGKSRRAAPALEPYPYRDLRWSPDGTHLLAIRRDGGIVELDAAAGTVARRFDVGTDQLLGATYAGDKIIVGRSSSAGDIWEAALR